MQQIEREIKKFYAFKFLESFVFFSAVLVPFFTQWGGITLAQTQIIQSWFMFWVFVAEVPTGTIADLMGRKYSLMLGTIVFGIGTYIYGLSPNFYNFLLAEFILAIAFALLSGADEALLYDLLKEGGREEDAKSIFGKARMFNLLGMMLSAPIGSLIAAKWGLNYPTMFTTIPMFVAALIASTLHEPTRANIVSESSRYIDVIKEGFKYFIKHPILRRLAVNGIVVATASYYIIWWYQPLLLNAGINVGVYGWFHLILLAAEILIASQFKLLERLVGSEQNYLRFSAFITGFTMILTAIWPSVITVTLLLVLGGGFGLTRLDYLGAIINKHVTSNKRATVLSSISMFRRLAIVPLNPILGNLADISLSLALVSVAVVVLGMVGWQVVRTKQSYR